MGFSVYSRKGWFRLWVLATIVYFVCLILAATDGFSANALSYKFSYLFNRIVVAGAIGSGTVFVLGWLVGWVVKGFRKQPE